MTLRLTITQALFATLLLLGTHAPAAAIDLSGNYVVDVVGVTESDIPCRLLFAQAGTTLQLSGSCYPGPILAVSGSGTVDPATGAFSLTGDLAGVCSGFVLAGSGDGEAFTATTSGDCIGNATVSGTKCSNGVIDPGENCEDGNHVDGDCCSARCTFDLPGTTCPNDGNVCTDDVCNATGTCTHPANTDPCDDHNPCTSGDVCTGGACLGSAVLAGQPCFNDGNACTDDVCNATGTCTHPANTDPCDDANPCTSGDVCTAGACVGSPNTDPCDDGNACSTGDVCTDGACVPTGVAAECTGTIDLTGTWWLDGPYISESYIYPWFPIWFLGLEREFVQTGAVLTASLPGGSPGIGAVNPATGAFRANVPTFEGCIETIEASVNPRGNAFDGYGLVMCADSVVVPPVAVTGSKCAPGQPCCGNGIVDAGEICDDQIACDATCQVPRDHYLCRKAGRAPEQPGFTPVQKTLEDQFQRLSFDVKKIKALCDPAQQDTGPLPFRPDVHAVGYPLTPSAGQAKFAKRTFTLTDQFGPHPVTVVRPVALLEPSAEATGSGGVGLVDTTGVDRFECYRAVRPRQAPRFATIHDVLVADEFGMNRYDLTKIVKVCTPTNANGEDPTAPGHEEHLVCYKAKPVNGSSSADQVVSINNSNFGPAVLVERAASELCVPALKAPATATP